MPDFLKIALNVAVSFILKVYIYAKSSGYGGYAGMIDLTF
ncbi:hypothetical protein l11_10850 [Neisseria weaveri LMG 5135]|nr:hypothetical protein l11_10850 [Neisseria weaveri LMG 5135]EGV38196.1 hypothetical protein l13_01480 [Neisseria weaveri ATCC 51223]